MVYIIPFEAEFRCDDGHVFTARVKPGASNEFVMCPECYKAWLDLNIPKGSQISTPYRSDRDDPRWPKQFGKEMSEKGTDNG